MENDETVYVVYTITGEKADGRTPINILDWWTTLTCARDHSKMIAGSKIMRTTLGKVKAAGCF